MSKFILEYKFSKVTSIFFTINHFKNNIKFMMIFYHNFFHFNAKFPSFFIAFIILYNSTFQNRET